MELQKPKACYFIGNPPERLTVPITELLESLDTALVEAWEDGCTVFFNSMDPGLDLRAAELVLQHRPDWSECELICVPPFEDYDILLDADESERYHRILRHADGFFYACQCQSITDPVEIAKLFAYRYQWMIEEADLIIAACHPDETDHPSLRYARRRDPRRIRYLEP